jgi:hypothetical protein
MIHEALADAFEAHHDRDAHLLEVSDGADAGAQEMRRRMDRTAREDDLAAAKLLFPTSDQRLDANAARTVEQQRCDVRVGPDLQIGAPANVAVEIAHRRRDASLGLIVECDREVAFDERAVLIGQKRVAGELAGLSKRLREPGPVLPRDAGDGNTAVRAVEGAVEIEVVLDLPEIGQHVLPAPARGAARFPLIVIRRRAAVGHLAVDRGTATQHARLLIFAQGRAVSSGLLWLTTGS